jgi:hypothetical protein
MLPTNRENCEVKNDISMVVNEEPVQIMLSAAHAGFSLCKVEFQPYLKGDDSLVSGFLTALSCISDAIFSRPLDRVKIGDYTMIMREENPFLFCYVFKGKIRPAIRRLEDFIEQLREEATLWNSMEDVIDSGAVDKVAISSIQNLATNVFVQTAAT